MKHKLKDGVNLHIYPVEKFKTVHIYINFLTSLTTEKLTNRTLLSYIQETNSKKYSNQQKMGEVLSELYGASMNTMTRRRGNYHNYSLVLNYPNPKFIANEEGLTEDVFQFLAEILFHPNVDQERFHEATFLREKEILEEEYASRSDDKRLYAALRLNELYYPDAEYQTPADGRIEDLEALTPSSLYTTYQEMIQNDRIEILVVGDVDEEKIVSYFEKLPLTERRTLELQPFYEPSEEVKVQDKTEIQNVQQAKLNLAYQAPFAYLSDDYFAMRVYNGLFGQYPHSKLFENVREKASLAYYATSRYNAFTGMMSVETGIDQKDENQARTIVEAQAEAMRQGKFTDEKILQTKAMIANGLHQMKDSPFGYMNYKLSNIIFSQPELTVEEFIDHIENVTKEDLVRIAANIEPKTTYILKGQNG